MSFGIGVIVGAIGMALLFIAFLLPELRAERDEARREIKVYRNLLIPAMTRLDPVARAEGAAVEPHPAPASVSAPVSAARSAASSKPAPRPQPQPIAQPKTTEEIWPMKIRYREKFKLLLRLTNSKQVRKDALASALEKQKPVQEPHNVTA